MLDLNGHWIDGPDYLLGNITGQEEGFPGGIRNAGHTNVLITNSKGARLRRRRTPTRECQGGVKEFGYGVLLAGTTFNVVENLIVQQNAMAGVELNDADDGRHGNTVRNNYIRDNELGVNIINDAYGSLIENNKIYGSLGEAIYIEFSNGHTVKGNEIVGVPFNPMLDSDGGFLLHSSSDNVIIGNTLRDTGDAGLVITQGSDHNRVGGPCVAGDGVAAGEGEGNKMWNNGDAGVYIQDSEHNKVCNNMAHQESDGGVVINSAHGTQIIGNDLRFNPNGIETSDSNDIQVIEETTAPTRRPTASRSATASTSSSATTSRTAPAASASAWRARRSTLSGCRSELRSSRATRRTRTWPTASRSRTAPGISSPTTPRSTTRDTASWPRATWTAAATWPPATAPSGPTRATRPSRPIPRSRSASAWSARTRTRLRGASRTRWPRTRSSPTARSARRPCRCRRTSS